MYYAATFIVSVFKNSRAAARVNTPLHSFAVHFVRVTRKQSLHTPCSIRLHVGT